MKMYNFKKALSGKYMFRGINLKNFPTNDKCISLPEFSNFETENTILLKGERRGVKKFQTWLKHYKKNY